MIFAGLLGLMALLPARGFAEQPGVPDKSELFGSALIREWTPPEYPPQLLKEKVGAKVKVRFIVDAAGKVRAARALEGADERFVEAALAAVRAWKFEAALDAGKPVEECLDVTIVFSPTAKKMKPAPGVLPPQQDWPVAVPRTPAKAKTMKPGTYPEALVDRKLPGMVHFRGVVDVAGRVAQPQIVWASHPDFVGNALEALKTWEFTPAMQGDLPIASELDGEVTFDSVLLPAGEVYEANGITAPDGSAAPVAPLPSLVADVVWPLDALLAGQGGSAVVEFTVTETGAVVDLRVREASEPAFGAALLAAMNGWRFERPIDSGHGTSVQLMRRVEFAAVPAEPPEIARNDPVVRLVLALRRGEIGGAKGLDAKLAPIFRVPPLYPRALVADGAPAGRAEIEFVIDRDGRARLPRIVSATREEFGWAAATAVAQWIFAPPRRGGQPVDVKAKIPFDFKPPET